jgi:hypothetical protein
LSAPLFQKNPKPPHLPPPISLACRYPPIGHLHMESPSAFAF